MKKRFDEIQATRVKDAGENDDDDMDADNMDGTGDGVALSMDD